MIARPRKPEDISPWDTVTSLQSAMGQTVLHIGYRANKDGIAWVGLMSPFDANEGIAIPAAWIDQIQSIVSATQQETTPWSKTSKRLTLKPVAATRATYSIETSYVQLSNT